MAHNLRFRLPFKIFLLGSTVPIFFFACAGLGVRNAVRDPDIPDLRARGRDPPSHVPGVLLLPSLLTHRYRPAGDVTDVNIVPYALNLFDLVGGIPYLISNF
jgi:hypothetical protein